MTDRLPPRIEKALIDYDDVLTSHFAQFGRTFDQAAVALENLRLAVPTDDIRSVRQLATNAIDKVMR